MKLDSFISHKFPFEQINEAFDLLHAGKWFVRLSAFICISLFFDSNSSIRIVLQMTADGKPN